MTPRSVWLSVLAYFGLFFGGGLGGSHLARVLAPGSAVAEFVSFLAFPAALALGVVGWVGASLPAAARRLVRLLARPGARASSPNEESSPATVPPGSFVFVPAGLITGALAGVVVAVLSTSLGSGWVLVVYAGLGLGYGVACWKLAQTGILGFPTE